VPCAALKIVLGAAAKEPVVLLVAPEPVVAVVGLAVDRESGQRQRTIGCMPSLSGHSAPGKFVGT